MPTPDQEPARWIANRLLSPAVLLVVAVIVGGMLAARMGPAFARSRPPAAPPVNLGVSMHPDGLELHWRSPSGDPPRLYRAQTQPLIRHGDTWEPADDWTELPLDTGVAVADDRPGPTTGPGTHRTRVDGATPGRTHRFRMRAVGDPTWSDPVEGLYVQPTLPVVRIDTDPGGPITTDKKRYRDATFTLTGDPDAEPVTDPDARIRGRGNATWNYVPGKKSYQLALSHEQALLGMPPADRWILSANYFDRSQLRTFAAGELARATELAWTPHQRWVELILDGDYAGVYQLGEKVDLGPDRVDLDPLDSRVRTGPDLTGGYLLQIEFTDKDHKAGWVTPAGVPVNIQRPKTTNAEQLDYISAHVNAFEAALMPDGPGGPAGSEARADYRRYLDTASFIDHWIVREVTAEPDAFHNSTYFTKPRGDDRLSFGPVWDFDRSMGSELSTMVADPHGWNTIGNTPGNRDLRPWVLALFADPVFVDEVNQRWNRHLAGLARVPDRIREVAPTLDAAKANDLLRWADSVDTHWEHRYGDRYDADEPAFLADWLATRIDWMTDALADLADGVSPDDQAVLARRDAAG